MINCDRTIVYKRYDEIDSQDNFNMNKCDLKKLLTYEGKKAIKEIRKLESINNMEINQDNVSLVDRFKNCFYQPIENDRTLVFESRFESGNLALASKVKLFYVKIYFWIKVSDNEYNLLLQNDTNTDKYSQWFFFQVTNTVKGMNVTFNILNYVL